MLPDTIKLELKAKHFKGTDFFDPANCPICKAAKEQQPDLRLYASTATVGVYVGGNRTGYMINNGARSSYDREDFQTDLTASQNQTANAVVRTITLTRQS